MFGLSVSLFIHLVLIKKAKNAIAKCYYFILSFHVILKKNVEKY